MTVADEVAHLRHYLEIMKLQMGERLQFSILMAEEAADIRCLKAVIQPIVENGIKHGIEPMEGTGRIDISIACDTKYATVCVQDNGCGFSNEKLMEIQTRFDTLSKESHIRDIIRVGLVNVNYRLQVFYGEKEETGLFISNREEAHGARVSLRFPVRRKETL